MGQIITVNFRGDQLYGFENDDGTYMAIKPMVESMGLSWEGQRQRLNRDPILSEGTCVMQAPLSGAKGQEVTCLKLELVNGWLFTIDTGRIKDDAVRERVVLYQRECYGVLHKHFYGRATSDRHAAIEGKPNPDEPMQTKRSLVTEARQTFGCQSARELWFKLGMPTTPSMYADEQQGDFFTYTAIKRDAPAADAA